MIPLTQRNRRMMDSDTAIRAEIGEYVQTLKLDLGYSNKRILEEFEEIENAKAISEATLIRSYQAPKAEDEPPYPIAAKTLKMIADSLRVILRREIARQPAVSELISNKNLDLSVSKDHCEPRLSYREAFRFKTLPQDKFYSWAATRQLELNSRKMYVITPDLQNALRIMDELIDEIKQKPQKRCYFMLTDYSAAYNLSLIQAKLRKQGEGLGDRIQFLKLWDAKLYNSEFELNMLTMVPIPYNVAIYFDVLDPISKQEVEYCGGASLLAEDAKEGGDLVIDKHRVKHIISWFEAIWEGCKGNLPE